MDEQGVSCNAAVQKIPDEDLPGRGNYDSRRMRIYKKIKKIPNE